MVSAALPPDYQNRTSEEKQDLLWQQISREPYPANSLPRANPGFFSSINLLFAPFLKKSFTAVSDEMPGTRQKLIHTYGAVAKINFRITTNSSYTGIFRSGGIGLARLSLARQDETNFIPGMGLKIFIDGHPSVNFHVMNSLEGQKENKNFFEKEFTNIIPKPSSWTLKALSKAFALAIWLLPGSSENRPESERNLPLYEHASVDSYGKVASPVVAPYQITFIPNRNVGWSPNTNDDLRVNLAKIPAGTVLYRVAVQRQLGTDEDIIGEIVTESEFLSSRYGDERLFFQHSRHRWVP